MAINRRCGRLAIQQLVHNPPTTNMVRSNFGILLVAIVGATLWGESQGANILGVFSSLSPSHLIVQMSMVKVLAEEGHNVTVVTALKPPVNHKDINVVQVPLSEEDQRLMSATIASMASTDKSNILVTMYRAMGQMSFIFEKMQDVLADQRVRDLYENKDNHFDLVIFGFFMNNYQLGLAHKLKAPSVLAVSMLPGEIFNGVFGNPNVPSFVPSMNMAVEKGHILTFTERVKNLFLIYALDVFLWFIENNNSKVYK